MSLSISPKATALFVHLTETEVIQGKDTEKYSMSLLLDPTENTEDAEFLKVLEGQQQQARAEAAKDAGPKSDKYELPQYVRSFSSKNKETGALEETNKVYVTFRSKYQPKVYNVDGQLIGLDEIRGGSKVKIEYSVVPFAMAATKKIGGALYVNNVQLIEQSVGANNSSFARASGSSFGTQPPQTSAIAKLMGEAK